MCVCVWCWWGGLRWLGGTGQGQRVCQQAWTEGHARGFGPDNARLPKERKVSFSKHSLGMALRRSCREKGGGLASLRPPCTWAAHAHELREVSGRLHPDIAACPLILQLEDILVTCAHACKITTQQRSVPRHRLQGPQPRCKAVGVAAAAAGRSAASSTTRGHRTQGSNAFSFHKHAAGHGTAAGRSSEGKRTSKRGWVDWGCLPSSSSAGAAMLATRTTPERRRIGRAAFRPAGRAPETAAPSIVVAFRVAAIVP